MKTILLTNDDGATAPGIKLLREILKNSYRVVTVAPDRERSAVSMGLTINHPLRITEIDTDYYSVNGTPVDCVNVAIQKVLGRQPDLLISGMNLGENLAEDVFFSGTVGAAFAGFLYNVPSLALSLIPQHYFKANENYPLEKGTEISKLIIDKLSAFDSLPATVINVNIPHNTSGQIRITSMGKKRYRPDIVENIDPRGRKYFWIGTGDPIYEGEEGSDTWAIQNGYVSISILKYNLNSDDGLDLLGKIFDEN